MSGSELIAYTRRKIGEETASFWSDDSIREKINEGQKQVARDTKCVKSYFTLTTVADTSEYSFASETEFLQEDDEGIWIYDGSDWDEVEVKTKEYLNEEYPDWKNATSDQPIICAIDRQQKKLWLYPPPSSTYAGTNYLKVYTIEITPDITSWSSELTVPQDLHFAIAFWACMDAKEDRGQLSQSQYWRQKYNDAVFKGAVDTVTHPARKIQIRTSR